MTYDYDLFVIGGGSAGVRAARLAASEAGARVALAEQSRMGGTCVIRGCVPKKLMLYAGDFAALSVEAQAYGWQHAEGAFDWPLFQAKLHKELARLEGIYRGILQKSNVTIFDQKAQLGSENSVILADGTKITARYILIATGGRAVKPAIAGADLAITSDQVFDLPALPRKLLIVGGGYIACEFAGIMHRLGVDVALVYRGTQILRGFDSEIASLLSAQIRAQGIKLQTQRNVVAITKTSAGLEALFTDERSETFDSIFFATGRAPNTEGLGLENANLTCGAKGEIAVDAFSQTQTPSIYAVGDVTNRVALTPVAIREATAFIETVFHKNPTIFDHTKVASAVFTRPEIGTIGLTEEEAQKREPIEIYTAKFTPMRAAFAEQAALTFMKLIISKKSRKILGCHLMGEYSGEMIQLAAIALTMGATKEDFDATCAVHPTIAEELVTMKKPTRST